MSGIEAQKPLVPAVSEEVGKALDRVQKLLDRIDRKEVLTRPDLAEAHALASVVRAARADLTNHQLDLLTSGLKSGREIALEARVTELGKIVERLLPFKAAVFGLVRVERDLAAKDEDVDKALKALRDLVPESVRQDGAHAAVSA